MRNVFLTCSLILSIFSGYVQAEIKPIAILGAMDAEIEKLLPEIKQKQQHEIAKNIYYTGNIAGKSVVIARSGVGKVNAAITTYVLINHFKAKNIIFTGIAGAVAEKLNVADVVISSALVQHDVDLTAFGAPMGQLSGYDDRFFKTDETLKGIALAAATNVVGKLRVHEGIIATGDQFIADKKRVNALQIEFNAMAVEMEGAAVAQVADMFDVPLVVIRTISDKADGSAHLTYSKAKQITADNSVAITVNMLEKM